MLNRDNCSLEELLEEDEVIQECKNMNTKLINFLSNASKLKQLINYIIIEPEAEDSHSRGHKFLYSFK